MSNPTITDAIGGLRDAFAAIVPPTGSLGSPARVWAWPADRASVLYETFPFILCAQVWGEGVAWREASQGVGFAAWPAEVLICLSNWTTRDDVSADQEAAAQAWLYAAAAVAFGNRSLNAQAHEIRSPDSVIVTTGIGPMAWLTTQTFFGVYCRVLVHQENNLPSL